MIKIFSNHEDKVIRGKVLNCITDYRTANHVLFPLVDKLDIQRKLQSGKFYKRLERDLLNGCIMPPLTIAFVIEKIEEDLEDFINQRIRDAFVLDGIQRLNTLHRAFTDNGLLLDLDRPLFLNIIICPSVDNLLYRMITLNNGQKPMTARHQIEILAEHLLDFDKLPIAIQSEKDNNTQRPKNAFQKADIIKAYLVFLTGLVNIDNQKIIEEKMDELIAEQVLDSDITRDHMEFSQVLELIEFLVRDELLFTWFNVSNNIIGFAAGIKKSFEQFVNINVNDFEEAVRKFEKSFTSINVSKIKLGQVRRQLVSYYISNYARLLELNENELIIDFMDRI